MKNQTNFITSVVRVLSTFLLISSVFASATDFVKGTHYNELAIPINDNNEVREFFSFYCPGCYRHEPIMLELKGKLPADIHLRKNHIDGMPGRDMSVEEMLSKALLTAQLLTMEEDIIEKIFHTIHVNKAKFTQEKEIEALFLLHDIDEQRFAKTFNSFSVKTGVSKMKKATEVLRNQGITSVPTVIVNGKYKVETKAISSKEQYIDLVLYLLNR